MLALHLQQQQQQHYPFVLVVVHYTGSVGLFVDPL
jgi:hypothetical protein